MSDRPLPEVIAELIEAAKLPQQHWQWEVSACFSDGIEIQVWVNQEGDRLTLHTHHGHHLLSLNNKPLICS